MKNRTIEISVGLFVVFGILSLLMLAMQVSGLSNSFREDKGYRVTAVFENIGGLKVRSKVTMAGVKIGRVTNVTLDRDDYYALVEMSIDPMYNNIPSDSEAQILTSGLLGDNYIGIKPGFEEKHFLKDGDHIDDTRTNSAVVLEDLISKFVTKEAGNEH